jgi:hypothetical protein
MRNNLGRYVIVEIKKWLGLRRRHQRTWRKHWGRSRTEDVRECSMSSSRDCILKQLLRMQFRHFII